MDNTTFAISPNTGVEVRGFGAEGFTTTRAADRYRQLLAEHGVVG
jgi:hypothetical protein